MQQPGLVVMPAVLLILALTITGGWLSTGFNLPIPGSIVGLSLLLGCLILLRTVPQSILQLSKQTAPYFPLFIVPASVGVMTQQSLLFEHGLILLAILFVSIIPGAIVSGLIMTWRRK